MGLRFEIPFDTGPEGAALVAGGNVTSVTGAVTYRAAAAMKGPFGVSMATVANASTFFRVAVVGTGALSHVGSLPYALNSLSGASVNVIRYADAANSAIMTLSMNVDGKFRILNSGGASIADSGPVLWVAGQRYRFDWSWDWTDPANPVLTVDIFQGVDSTVSIATLFATIPTALTFSHLMIGAVGTGGGGSTRSWDADNLRVFELGDVPGALNPAPPTPAAANIGSGGVEDTVASMRVLTANIASVRFAVSTAPDMSGPVFTAAAAPTVDGYSVHQITGLTPSTPYWYQTEGDGVLLGPIGEFVTAAAPGAPEPSLRIIGMSCHVTGSNDPIFDVVAARTPDLIMHGGDRGYPWSGVVAPNNEAQLTNAFEAPWAQSRQASLHEQYPIDYLFDDADGPGSNGDGTFPAFPLLGTVYRKMFPTHAVPAAGPLYWSMVRGRVRIIRTDARSASSAKGDPDGPGKTLFGATQDAWFEDQLDQALAARELVLWFGNNEWVGSPVIDGNVDQPRAYPTWRNNIAAMITSRGMQGQVIYSFWDTHALAGDDGSGNPYGGFARFCMAPMHQQANAYTFPASAGFYPPGVVPAAHQYAELNIVDDGDTITTTIVGRTGDDVDRVTLVHEFVPFEDHSGEGHTSAVGDLDGEADSLLIQANGSLGAVGVLSGVGTAPGQVPAYPDECWPVDTSCCDGWADYDSVIRARAISMATMTLRMLTAYQLGGCPVTVRPCKAQGLCGGATWMAAVDGYGSGGQSWTPFNLGGTWINVGCGCGPQGCSCGPVCEIVLPGPVGSIEEIRIDGVLVDPSTYRVDNGNLLVRQGDECWPTCQDMTAPAGDPNTFTVTYLQGHPIDGNAAYAAGVLACEYAKACSGAKCRLPDGVTSVARQGVVYTIAPGSFPSGFTGIREVDAVIRRWNPNGAKMQSTVWSPDTASRRPRRTTWISS